VLTNDAGSYVNLGQAIQLALGSHEEFIQANTQANSFGTIGIAEAMLNFL